MANLSKTFQEGMPFEFSPPETYDPSWLAARDAIEHALMALRMMAVDRGLKYGEDIPEFSNYKKSLNHDLTLLSESDEQAKKRALETHHEFWLDYARKKGIIGGDNEPRAIP